MLYTNIHELCIFYEESKVNFEKAKLDDPRLIERCAVTWHPQKSTFRLYFLENLDFFHYMHHMINGNHVQKQKKFRKKSNSN